MVIALTLGYDSVSSETTDSAKNMIKMKSVITGVGCLVGISTSGVLINNFAKTSIPVNLIMSTTTLTTVLFSFLQNPQIKEFLCLKLSQKKINLTETLLGFKQSISRKKTNKVGVHNAIEQD